VAFIKTFEIFKRVPWFVRTRTPTLLQMEAVECGAAAIGIILAHYGRYVPLSELRRECGVSRDGSQASHLINAGKQYGLEANAYSIEFEDLADLPCPYIIFWNFNHFVVVEGIGRNRVYLNDPATGPRTVSLEEFRESYTGIILYFEPEEGFVKGGQKPSALRGLYRRLKGSAGALVYCILLGFLLVLPGLAIPVLSQIFVDNVLIQGLDDWLRPLIFGIILTAILRGIFTVWQLKFLRALKLKLSIVMSSRFFWHVLRLPVSFYSQRYAGEIGSRVDINNKVAETLSGRLASTVIDLFMIVFYAIAMFYYDTTLASIGVISAILNLLALQWIARRRTDANMRLVQEHGKVGGLAIAGLQGIESLKASGLESNFFTRWAGTYAKAMNAQQELGVSSQVLGNLPSLLSSITAALILIVGGLRVMDGVFSIGMLVAFQSLMQSFLNPVANFVGLGSTIQELRGDLNRLDDVYLENEDRQVKDENIARLQVEGVRLAGRVELRNLTFGYNRVTAPLISDLNLIIEPGQRIAFVGPSGSGKSTIARLICGLYEPWHGDILFDGKSRSELHRQILTTSIALVEQDIFLFEGSIRENLTLWQSSVLERDLIQACRDANIYEDIMSLPGGYESKLDEGARNLSGGQRQRLEIARALINRPSILVLDEATSALDAETERLIDRNLRRRGCSCVIVAHRLSTIRDCDEIILLNEGKVLERGTHLELLKAGGAYASLISIDGQALREDEIH
jgi:ATP-binding cassette subfamily C protein